MLHVVWLLEDTKDKEGHDHSNAEQNSGICYSINSVFGSSFVWEMPLMTLEVMQLLRGVEVAATAAGS